MLFNDPWKHSSKITRTPYQSLQQNSCTIGWLTGKGLEERRLQYEHSLETLSEQYENVSRFRACIVSNHSSQVSTDKARNAVFRHEVGIRTYLFISEKGMAGFGYNILFDLFWHGETETIIHYNRRIAQVEATKLPIICSSDQYLDKQETSWTNLALCYTWEGELWGLHPV